MKSITIVMEGGGETAQGRAAIRQGMDRLLGDLKQQAREQSVRWKLVPWGSREQAYKRFRAAVQRAEADVVVLLVDSEGPVAATPEQHLADRDGWQLGFAAADTVHLMVQSMETWIVADSAALAAYYGSAFRSTALPTHSDLEAGDRTVVGAALKRATQATVKREYHKIRDGGRLLGLIDPAVVARACPSCAALFDAISSFLGPTARNRP